MELIASIKDFVLANYGKLTINSVTGTLAGIQIGSLIETFVPATSVFGFWGGLAAVIGLNLWALTANKTTAPTTPTE